MFKPSKGMWHPEKKKSHQRQRSSVLSTYFSDRLSCLLLLPKVSPRAHIAITPFHLSQQMIDFLHHSQTINPRRSEINNSLHSLHTLVKEDASVTLPHFKKVLLSVYTHSSWKDCERVTQIKRDGIQQITCDKFNVRDTMSAWIWFPETKPMTNVLLSPGNDRSSVTRKDDRSTKIYIAKWREHEFWCNISRETSFV
jgi:hypothetical protein